MRASITCSDCSSSCLLPHKAVVSQGRTLLGADTGPCGVFWPRLRAHRGHDALAMRLCRATVSAGPTARSCHILIVVSLAASIVLCAGALIYSPAPNPGCCLACAPVGSVQQSLRGTEVEWTLMSAFGLATCSLPGSPVASKEAAFASKSFLPLCARASVKLRVS